MNQRQKNNNIFMGAVLIFLALYIVVSRLIDLPGIPVFKIIFTCMFGYTVYKGVRKRDYGMIFIPSAILLCMYDDILGIQDITPFVVMAAAVLLTVGFNMIFKRGKSDLEVVYDSSIEGTCTSDYKYNPEKRKVVIDNSFGAVTRYIQEEDLREVVIDNGLGTCTVYFQNVTLENNILKMKVDNGLGTTTVYFPKEWSINLNQDNGLGRITVNGQPSSDPQSPCVDIFVDNGLGAVNLNFI